MGYCNGVEGFIKYTLSNLRNISGDDSRCPNKRCKNKNVSQSRYCYNASLKKKGLWRNTCVGLHIENHMFLIKPW